MDTTETYIKMCKESLPLLKGSIPLFSRRRWMQYAVDGKIGLWAETVNTSNYEGAIPLWTQDQLQEMYAAPDDIYTLLHDFNEWIDQGERDSLQCKSLEQLWLAFVMKEKHGQVWNEEEWDAVFGTRKTPRTISPD